MDIIITNGATIHISVWVFIIIAAVLIAIVGAAYSITKEMVLFLDTIDNQREG